MRQRWSAARAVLLWVILPGCFGSWLSSEYGWAPQKEFVFSVQGQSLAGLPGLKDQYAGFTYRGELRVQSHSPRVLLVKMLNMNYTNIHEEVSEGWWKLKEAPKNRTKTFPLTTSTVVVKLTKNTSPELVMQAGLQDWEVNFLKGVVGNVLAFLGDNSSSGQSSNMISQLRQSDDVFSVVEDSVVGRCPVLYEVSKTPAQLNPAPSSGACAGQPLWTVTKNRNLSDCQILNEDHAHLPPGGCTPGGANCGHFWTRASLSEMIGCGNRNNFVLLSSVSVFKINAQLHLQKSSEAVVNSNLNISLTSVMDLRRRFDPPQNKQSYKSLLYTYSTSPIPDKESSSEEEAGSKKSRHGAMSGKMDPTNGDNEKKGSGKNSTENLRIKRAIRGKNVNKYRSNTPKNNDESWNQQSSSGNSNGDSSSNEQPNNNRNHNTLDRRSYKNDKNGNRNNDNSWNQQPGSDKYGDSQTEQPNNDGGDDNPWNRRSSKKNRNGNRNTENSWNQQPGSSEDNDDSRSEQSNNGNDENSWNTRSDSNNRNDNPRNRRPGSRNNGNYDPWPQSPDSQNSENDNSDNRGHSYSPGSFSKKNNNKNKNTSPESSEEYDQNSEEQELEENWNISGKETKSSPPHQPFNMFALAHRTSYDLTCLTPKLSQTVADISGELGDGNIIPEKHTLDKLSLAVDLCRTLPLDQLQSVSQEVFEIHSSAANVIKNTQRMVFRDIMMMCGTHPALQMIKGWVERKQVEGEEAAQLISSLPTHIFSPTKYLVQDFLEMVQQIAEQNDDQLTTSGVLALSNLVRRACVNGKARKYYFSSIVRPVCDKEVASKVSRWLASKIKPRSTMTRAYIEALGNIGSSKDVGTLEDVVLNPEYGTYLQTTAVYAMRYTMLQKDPAMPPLLLRLYHNYTLPVGVRVAASAMLVYSQPGLPVWQRLAISTWYDPSPAVSQFVASSIRTMASSQDTLYSNAMKSARLVQGLARPSRLSPHQPYNLLNTWHSAEWERVIVRHLAWMRLHDFSSYYLRHSSRASGFSRTNIAAAFQTSSPDGIWKALKEMMSSSNENNRHRQNPKVDIKRSLQNIESSLNLQRRSIPDLQASLHLKVDNMMDRLFMLNRDTLKSWIKGGRKMASQMISEGKALSFQKADMSSVQISTTTEMGFPVEFSVRSPWVVNAIAELNKTKEGISMGASFMYSSQLLASVGVMSAWDKTSHSAGARVTNFMQVPTVRTTVSADRDTGVIKVKTSFVDQTRILYFAMQPYTSQQKIKLMQPAMLNSETNLVNLAEPTQVPLSGMSHYLNAVYTAEKSERFNPMDYVKEAREVLGFPLLMPNLEFRTFEAVLNPLHPVAMNLSMSLASKSMGLLEMESHNSTVIGKLINALNTTDNAFPQPPFSDNENVSNNKNGTEGESSSDNSEYASTTVSYQSTTSKTKEEYKSNQKSENKSENASPENNKDQLSSEQKDKNKGESASKEKDESSSNNNDNNSNEKNKKSNASDENVNDQSSESRKENKDSNDRNKNKDDDSSSHKGNKDDSSSDNDKKTQSSTENKNDQSKSEEEKNTKKSSKKGQNKSSEENDDDMEEITSTVYPTTFESVTGDFNASTIDPFTNTVNDSCNSYLIEQILSKINSGKAMVLGFNLESTNPDQPTKMSAYASYATTYSQRASRFGLFLRKDSSQVKMTSAHLDPVDIVLDLKKRVSEDLQHKFYVDYVQKSEGKDIQASAKATLGMSRSRLEQLKSSPDLETCAQNDTQHFDSAIDKKCQKFKSLTKEIGFGNVTFYYNNDAKFIERTAVMYMDAARVLAPRTEEWGGEGGAGVTAMLDSEPRTESVDAFLATADSGVLVRAFPLSRLPMPLGPLVEWATRDGSTQDYCGISSKRVHTFDGYEIQYKMKDSWYLLAKDCSGRDGISVIARPSSNNTMKLEVNVNDEAAVSMESEGEAKRVSVNGKAQQMDTAHALLMVTDSAGRTLAHLVHTPDSVLNLRAPDSGLDLVYTGTSLVIRMDESLQGRICGLCGSYTNSGIEQFLTPRGSPANSPQEFASSYAMKMGA